MRITHRMGHTMEITYSDDGKTAEVDGIRFTRDSRTGYYLSSQSIHGKRKRLHVYVWEKHNGSIPKGYEVHHATGDKARNEIDDLQLLTAEEHRAYHINHMSEERREQLRKNLEEKARPKASEWHRSEEGREWHRKHGRDTWKNRKPITYTCTNCGNEFESLNVYTDNSNRFCCNNCKSAWRRKTGVDNEQRNCEICGSEFTANKYSKAKRCSQCRHIKRS